ncbi:MAG: phosphatase PAP2 family protein, partial [Aquabacterium sp.]
YNRRADATAPNPPRHGGPTDTGLPGEARRWRDPRTQAQWDWEGVDADWTYADAWTLLGQALRKSRAKIAQPVHVPDAPPPPGQLGQGKEDRPALWRWQPEHRVHAVVGELAARSMVHDKVVYLVDVPSAAARRAPRSVSLHPVMDLKIDMTAIDQPAQIDKVLRAAVEREDRLPEILSQANDIDLFFESITGVSPGAAPLAYQLLDVAQTWAHQLLMVLKNQIAQRRPVEVSGSVMPVIATPGHGSLPSGHATIAALTAALWSELLYDSSHAGQPRVGELDRLARRIAFNRVVAGVHFPVDSVVGYRLGTQLARCFIALAGVGAQFVPQMVTTEDALIDPARAHHDPGVPELLERGLPCSANHNTQSLEPAPQLALLYARAADELALIRI